MRRFSVVASAIAIWMLTMGVVLHTAPAEAGPNSFQYLDRFNSGNYNGNDGTDDYQGPWWENNDWGGPTNGAVTIESGSRCPNERCVRINGRDDSFWGTGLMRWADTDGANQVQLSFQYSIRVREATDGYLNIGVFDGSGWKVVGTIWLTDHEDDPVDDVFTKLFTVTQYAHEDFMVGFFAHDEWDAAIYLDRVQVFGDWDSGATTTTTTTTNPPTTTTTSTTTTIQPPTTTSTTTNPPVTTTTSTTVAPTTTAAPTTTTSTTTTTTTTTTLGPRTTTVAPTTTIAAAPPATTTPPTTIAVITPAVPIDEDDRYNDKTALINANIGGEIMALPAAEDTIVAPGPVTQIMASLTTTAVTVRSHLLSAMALGLLIAVAAIWGLGKREVSA